MPAVACELISWITMSLSPSDSSTNLTLCITINLLYNIFMSICCVICCFLLHFWELQCCHGNVGVIFIVMNSVCCHGELITFLFTSQIVWSGLLAVYCSVSNSEWREDLFRCLVKCGLCGAVLPETGCETWPPRVQSSILNPQSSILVPFYQSGCWGFATK